MTSGAIGHRITDVILRSCTGYPESALIDRDLREVFGYAPNSLLFGCWHSNRKGGPGLRIARSVTSEIVAVDAEASPHVSSRCDPLPFSKASKIEIDSSVAGWSLGGKGKGKPSDALLGNIPPDIEGGRGVTMKHAEQTCVISLSSLRNLQLGDVAHGVLAAIGVAAFMRAFGDGCWLRSRCQLIPTSPVQWEVIHGVNSEPLGDVNSDDLLREVCDRVKGADLPWYGVTELQPSEQLSKLVEEGKSSLGLGKE